MTAMEKAMTTKHEPLTVEEARERLVRDHCRTHPRFKGESRGGWLRFDIGSNVTEWIRRNPKTGKIEVK